MMMVKTQFVHHVDINVTLVKEQNYIVYNVNPTELTNLIVIAQLDSMLLMKNQNVKPVTINVMNVHKKLIQDVLNVLKQE